MSASKPAQLFRKRPRATVAGACIVVFSVCCFPAGLAALGQFLVKTDAPQHADAILVLGGDFLGPRVTRGADLGVSGFATRVLISGPPYQNRPESELAIEFMVGNGYPRALFLSLPNSAKSTIEEAIALAPQLRQLNVRHAILVTRNSHSRRAALVFGLFCPGIHFVSVPAKDRFNASSWWTDAESRRLFCSEWSKMLGTVLWKYPEFRIINVFRHM